MDPYKGLVETLNPHSINAQIFFEIDNQQMTVEQARIVLESVGLKMLHQRIIHIEDTVWALIHISSNDMRTATLKLSEAGFGHVMGINPKPANINSKSGRS